jgi:hypothetical protein
MRKSLELWVAALEMDMRMLKQQLELVEIRVGVRRGVEQAVRGEGVDTRKFMETIRNKILLG